LLSRGICSRFAGIPHSSSGSTVGGVAMSVAASGLRHLNTSSWRRLRLRDMPGGNVVLLASSRMPARLEMTCSTHCHTHTHVVAHKHTQAVEFATAAATATAAAHHIRKHQAQCHCHCFCWCMAGIGRM
jgi:hypothetical protein